MFVNTDSLYYFFSPQKVCRATCIFKKDSWHQLPWREKIMGFFSFPFGWSTLLCPHKWRIMFSLNRWAWLRTFYQTTTKSTSIILTAGPFCVDLQNVYLPKTSPHTVYSSRIFSKHRFCPLPGEKVKHGGRALNVFVLFVVNHQMLPTILREKLCYELSWVSLLFVFRLRQDKLLVKKTKFKFLCRKPQAVQFCLNNVITS